MISFLLFLSFIPIKTIFTCNFQLTVVPGCNKNTLNWNPFPNASTYQAYLYLADDTTYPLFDFPQPDLFYLHKDLIGEKEYCYVVVAYDKDAKEIGKSNRACAIPENCNDPDEDECEIELKYTMGKKSYFVNNKPFEMDTEPEIKHNRVHLVISFVTKHIPGTSINWDNADRRITIVTAKGKTVQLWVDKTKAEIDGKMVEIDPANPGQVAPYIKNSRTYVPLRFATEQLDAEVQWVAETRTVVLKVKDIVNCGCKWICGCIKKGKWVRKDNGNTMQFYFDEYCDNAGNEQHFQVDNTLRDLNLHLEFEQYFNSYTHEYWCLELCVDNSTPPEIIKWKANPNRYPDCCPPAQPPIKICGCIVPHNNPLGYGFQANCTGNIVEYTMPLDLDAINTGHGQTYVNPDRTDGKYNIKNYITQWPSGTNNDDPDDRKWCVEIWVGPDTETIVKWEMHPDREDNCCEAQSICGCIVRMVTSPDTDGNYYVTVSTNCQEHWDRVLYFPDTLMDLTHEKNVYDHFYTDLGGPPNKLCFEAEYDPVTKIVSKWWACPDKIPPDCCCETLCGCFSEYKIERGGTFISFIQDCNPDVDITQNQYFIPWNMGGLSSGILIADYIEQYPQMRHWCLEICIDNEDKVISWKATPERYPDCCKPNDVKGRIQVTIDNKECWEKATISIEENRPGTPNTNLTGQIDPRTGMYDTGCELPCPGSYTVSVTHPDCTMEHDHHIITMSDQACCDYIHKAEFKCACSKKGRIQVTIDNRECWEEATISIYKGVSRGEPKGSPILTGQIDPRTGMYDTGCELPCPGTYTVIVTHPDCTMDPDKRIVTMSDQTCCDYIHKAEFKCECKTPSCCDWIFRTRPELGLKKLELCPGEAITIVLYEVFNNCPKGSNDLTFTITFPNDGKIVTVSPSSFTLQAQERKTLKITIKMPDCKANDVVFFPLKISTRECGEKQVEFKAFCKDCWCKHLSKIIKVTKIDLRGGWLEGTPADSKTPIRFFFDATQKQWANIKLEQCIEICYEERKERGGNTINWAFDYRVVECP